MYAYVDESNCIGCGSCVAVCPAVFEMSDRGVAVAMHEVKKDMVADVKEAMNMCPVRCIDWDED